MNRVFEPFFSTKGEKGTGLGLSMVYGFVNQSGGRINIESSRESGTCVTLAFPSTSSTTNAEGEPTQTEPGSGENVLLVEDDPDVRALVSYYVESLDYLCETAKDIDTANAMMGAQSFDILITDVVLPGEGNGFDVARRFQKIHPNARIIVISGFTEVDDQAPEVKDGKWLFLSKPFPRSDLAEALQGVSRE